MYRKYECFVMHMLYACVLCASCGSSPCCILHDLQFVNTGRGCNRRPYMFKTALNKNIIIPHPYDDVRMRDFYMLCRLCVH